MSEDTHQPYQLMTMPQIAAYLGIPRSSLYLARDSGDFPPAFFVAGRDRWQRADIDAWIASRRTTPETPTERTI